MHRQARFAPLLGQPLLRIQVSGCLRQYLQPLMEHLPFHRGALGKQLFDVIVDAQYQ